LQREDFGYIKPMSNEWVVSPQAAVAIPGAVRLFNRAKSAGVDAFFITARPDSQTTATARNLEAAGFHGWKGLALRSDAESFLPTIAYKSGRRKQIVAQGYRIILSVGDQWSDLNGDPKAEVSVKLPNPFYFLP
jgi:predicted secreted acid phosphatase